MSTAGDITTVLQRWNEDRNAAMEELTPLVYAELHKIAAGYLRRQRPDHTLQPTALINEAYMCLVNQASATFEDRSHFYALAARMMRHILVDVARAHLSQKRGSGQKVQFDDRIDIGGGDRNLDFLALHEAIEMLHESNPRVAQAVELRYFGGLELTELAETLGVSLATVKRDLTLGEAYLRRALASVPHP